MCPEQHFQHPRYMGGNHLRISQAWNDTERIFPITFPLCRNADNDTDLGFVTNIVNRKVIRHYTLLLYRLDNKVDTKSSILSSFGLIYSDLF